MERAGLRPRRQPGPARLRHRHARLAAQGQSHPRPRQARPARRAPGRAQPRHPDAVLPQRHEPAPRRRLPAAPLRRPRRDWHPRSTPTSSRRGYIARRPTSISNTSCATSVAASEPADSRSPKAPTPSAGSRRIRPDADARPARPARLHHAVHRARRPDRRRHRGRHQTQRLLHPGDHAAHRGEQRSPGRACHASATSRSPRPTTPPSSSSSVTGSGHLLSRRLTPRDAAHGAEPNCTPRSCIDPSIVAAPLACSAADRPHVGEDQSVGDTIWDRLEECVQYLTEPFRASEIVGWFRRHYPDVKEQSLRAHIQVATSNASAESRGMFANRQPLITRIAHGLYRRFDGVPGLVEPQSDRHPRQGVMMPAFARRGHRGSCRQVPPRSRPECSVHLVRLLLQPFPAAPDSSRSLGRAHRDGGQLPPPWLLPRELGHAARII